MIEGFREWSRILKVRNSEGDRSDGAGGGRSLVERISPLNARAWVAAQATHGPSSSSVTCGRMRCAGRKVAAGLWRQPEAWPWCSQLCDPGKWLHYPGPRCLFFLIQLFF